MRDSPSHSLAPSPCTVVSRGLSGGRDIGQRPAMRSFRAPPDHHVRVTRGEDLFDIEVKIGKRRNVQLQELPSAFVTSKRGRKGSSWRWAYPSSRASAYTSTFSSQYVMPISRYIVVAMVRCSCACSCLPVRR
jgi:hypothetical protein